MEEFNLTEIEYTEKDIKVKVSMSKLIIINGPNLNLLGEREQTQYGSKDYKYLEEICLKRAEDLNIDIEMKQSNV